MMYANLVSRFVVAAALYLALTFAVFAQEAGLDYASWEAVAVRAETAASEGRASDTAFDTLRAEVSDWRLEFEAQLTTNDDRLATLNSQITALGPVPEGDAQEAEEIAMRRAELEAQRLELEAPRRRAAEAFQRADGIIDAIDGVLRTRQTTTLFRMGPWPINVEIWPRAVADLTQTLMSIGGGISDAFANPNARQAARDRLPLALGLSVIGLFLLIKSRFWVESAALRVQHGKRRARAAFGGFLVSLGQFIIPLAGLWAVIRAIELTGLFDARGALALNAALVMGLAIFVSRWIASRLAPPDSEVTSALLLDDPQRRAVRRYVFALGIIYALQHLLGVFSDYEQYSAGTRSVLHFPLILIASFFLMRLAGLLKVAASKLAQLPEVDRSFGQRMLGFLRYLILAAAYLAPVLASFGYSNAAIALIYPSLLTLALSGVVVLLQGFVRDFYAVLRGGEDARDGLIPTLVGFVLLLLALPILALIWGARVTDLTELWAAARNGLTIGEMTISPSSFLMLALVFAIGYLMTRAAQSALKSSVLPKTRIEPGGQTALVSGVGYIGIFLSALVAITAAGIDLSNLAIVAGALSVGIGFGLQNIVSNFVSGIILLIERPVSEGDWIEVGGNMGHVRRISVRSTRIETFDRSDVIVPNSDLVSGTVTNYTRGNTVGRIIMNVGVAYGTDTRRVEAILREIAEAHPMALVNPPPGVVFSGFGADSLDFEIRILLRDVNWGLSVRSEINHQIAERFVAEGIEIPFAQRDIWLRNPEALDFNEKNKKEPSASVASVTPEAQMSDMRTMLHEKDLDSDGDGAES